jgi:antitoxin (DNA-binding transcriptional repressor) of toxin-antitoxin stability system
MTTGFGFCANCGTPRLAADQKFCAVCGSALSPTAPPAPAQAAPAAPPAPAPAPVFAEAPAAAAPEVEAAIPAPPATETAAAEAPAAPPPWAPSAAPPAHEPAPPVLETAPVPVAPPPAPPAWSVPPAPNQGAAAPPAWSQPPAPPAYQAAPTYPAAPTYQAPPPATGAPAAAAASFKITPKLLLIGAVVLAVIVGAFLYLNTSSSYGSLTFTPSTVSCSKPVAFTVTAHLPSSVKAGDKVTITLDGKPVTTSTVAEVSDMIQQPDGSWTSTSTTTADTMQAICSAGGGSGGFNLYTPGTHTMQVLDSSGKVIASGSYTVTP